jgi:hypothetical protein
MANVKNGKEKELSGGACIHYIFHAVFVRSLEVMLSTNPRQRSMFMQEIP